MISFKQYLIEGLIKLPPAMRDEMVNKTLRCFYSLIKYCAERDQTGTVYAKTNKTIATELKSHGLGFLDHDEIEKLGTLYERRSKIKSAHLIKWDEMPQSYYKKLLKITNDLPYDPTPEKNDITLVLSFKPSTDSGTFTEVDNAITVNISTFIDEDNLTASLARVDQLIAVVEHEMMHMVQFLLLEHFHEKQVEFRYSDESQFDDPEYTGSVIEFQPLIRTALGEWSTVVKKLEHRKEKFNEDELLKIFLCATSGPHRLVEPSRFFMNLKRISQKKWRTACRLFYKEL